MLKLSGLPREAYAGRNIRDIVESGIFQKESVTLRAIQEKQTVTDFQQYQNGRTVLVTAIPIFDGGNSLIRVLSITHDITDQIIMKKKGRRNREAFSKILYGTFITSTAPFQKGNHHL
ncbi:PAS domain-containing protein [Peribacillus frigoritolerans]|nr:PAS domain-containing protein [Peribacillus frigoritolerans]